MKEEKYLIEKCGKENPFKTPEGYFENFTRNIMEQLPEKEIQAVPETTLWHRIRPWMYMAVPARYRNHSRRICFKPAAVQFHFTGRIHRPDSRPDHDG